MCLSLKDLQDGWQTICACDLFDGMLTLGRKCTSTSRASLNAGLIHQKSRPGISGADAGLQITITENCRVVPRSSRPKSEERWHYQEKRVVQLIDELR